MKTNIKHNKIKNTGILFELLSRQIATDVLRGKEKSVAVRLMKEYFSPKSELGRELVLYRTFFGSTQLSEQKAFQLLNLVVDQYRRLDHDAIRSEKYRLISEIQAHYDLKEFFSTRVPSYRIYASIYKVFNTTDTRLQDVATIGDLAESQFTIVEHLKGNHKDQKVQQGQEVSQVLRESDDDRRTRIYTAMVEKFNTKYSDLSAPQKRLLQEYIYNTADAVQLASYVRTESQKLVKIFENRVKKLKDQVTKIKMNEAISQLKKFEQLQVVKENHMAAMLIAYEILKEVEAL